MKECSDGDCGKEVGREDTYNWLRQAFQHPGMSKCLGEITSTHNVTVLQLKPTGVRITGDGSARSRSDKESVVVWYGMFWPIWTRIAKWRPRGCWTREVAWAQEFDN